MQEYKLKDQEFNQSNLDTNNKDTVFGIAFDGKEIVSARKIKGELIGSYVILGILCAIVQSIITSIVLTPMYRKITYSSILTNLDNILQQIIIISIIITIISAIVDFLIIYFSTRIVFKKRKMRRIDISNVIKGVIIYQVIILCIGIYGAINSYMSGQKSIDSIEKMGSYATYITNDKSYKQDLSGAKTYYIMKLVLEITIYSGTAVGCTLLQKKLLNKNAED